MVAEKQITWPDSLKTGIKVIVQSDFAMTQIESVQAFSKTAVYVGGECFKRQGDYFVCRKDGGQSWLIEATEERVSALNDALASNREAAWDAFSNLLNALSGTRPDGPAKLMEWWVLTPDGDPNKSFLKDPLMWNLPHTVVLRNTTESDIFTRPVSHSYVDKIFAVMALCPQHVFYIDTLYADRMRAYLEDEDTPMSIGNAAATFLDGKWIQGEGSGYRKRIENLIDLAHGFEPGTESDAPASGNLLPLPNIVFGQAPSEDPTQ